ncbi:head-tail connector protein [Epibacterium ulvae]|uniref:head-tail connector protein n=1 Tax=Epibacterium ulvae TaxID=1156985 RepID=UPI0024902843|nr:head-tail connector protein [Epibacterium ulvae]
MLKAVVTAPDELPIDLSFIQSHAVVDSGVDEDLLQFLTGAAVARLDGMNGLLGRAIMPQDVVQAFPRADLYLRLQYGPAFALNSVSYFDRENSVVEISNARIFEDDAGSFVQLDSLPNAAPRIDAVTVSYRAGWQSAALVPNDVKLAIAMMVATWYHNREDMTSQAFSHQVPGGVRDLIAPYRRVGI